MTGTLDPDVTGDYEPIDPWNGKPSYELAGNGWYLWWLDSIERWIISQTRGNDDGPSWQSTSAAIEGVYSPVFPATGNATVAEI